MTICESKPVQKIIYKSLAERTPFCTKIIIRILAPLQFISRIYCKIELGNLTENIPRVHITELNVPHTASIDNTKKQNIINTMSAIYI